MHSSSEPLRRLGHPAGAEFRAGMLQFRAPGAVPRARPGPQVPPGPSMKSSGARSSGCSAPRVGLPPANASAMRRVRTVQTECLDWLLVLNRTHPEQVLPICVRPYNQQRPGSRWSRPRDRTGCRRVPPQCSPTCIGETSTAVRYTGITRPRREPRFVHPSPVAFDLLGLDPRLLGLDQVDLPDRGRRPPGDSRPSPRQSNETEDAERVKHFETPA